MVFFQVSIEGLLLINSLKQVVPQLSRETCPPPVSIVPEEYWNNETYDEENDKECEDRRYLDEKMKLAR